MTVTVVDQHEGMLFTGSGDLMHFGRTTSTRAMHEATNYFPVQWLVTGPPICLALLGLFKTIRCDHSALALDES